MNMKLADVVIKRSRVSDQIKETIKQAILNEEFKAGDKLPREDQLADIFKVSKVSVREALRDLEGEGLIEKRRGLFGGNFVAQPNINKINDLLANYYQFGTVTPEDFLEFTQILEPTLISLAVKRRKKADLEKIQTNIEERKKCFAKGKIATGKITEFHKLVGNSCHNQLCSVVMQALMNISGKILSRDSVTLKDFEAHLNYSIALYGHLLKKDQRRAQKTMATIFEHYMEIYHRDSGAVATDS
jgi:GntR family transcriptional repressor for pyruvate dehydrogenase complex